MLWNPPGPCIAGEGALVTLAVTTDWSDFFAKVPATMSLDAFMKVSRLRQDRADRATINHHENLTYSKRVDKSNKYSQAKAEDKFEKRNRVSVFTLVFIFPVSFVQVYFFKGHFLDGVDGLLTSMNFAFYNFMKYAKLWELNRGRGDQVSVCRVAWS